MKGRVPKNPALLQRRNKTSTRATLPSVSDSASNEVPPLPARAEQTTDEPEAPAKRGSATERGYGVEHQAWRMEVLKAHPVCVDCGEPATEADHIVPKDKGGKAFDVLNGTGRCKKCHAKKTARDQKLYTAKANEAWHPMVLAWWKCVWQSPMASEYLEPDVQGGLYLLADLYQRRWTTDNTKDLVAIACEIRQQEIRFGLSPIDRRRLQWEVEKAEQAEERTQTRRQRKEVSGKDPRDVLKVV